MYIKTSKKDKICILLYLQRFFSSNYVSAYSQCQFQYKIWLQLSLSVWMPLGNVWVMGRLYPVYNFRSQSHTSAAHSTANCPGLNWHRLTPDADSVHEGGMESMCQQFKNDWCLPPHQSCLSQSISLDEIGRHLGRAAGVWDRLAGSFVFSKGETWISTSGHFPGSPPDLRMSKKALGCSAPFPEILNPSLSGVAQESSHFQRHWESKGC